MRVRRVRIPKERIAPAIGEDGEVKEEIEDKMDVDLEYDSESGMVMIKGEKGSPLNVIKAQSVIKAVGRGFSPQKAYQLFDDENFLEILDVTDFSGNSEKAKRRLKGRVIGRNGRTRELIEEYTGTSLSIYGKTISCIGISEDVEIAREAIEMLLNGTPHSAVYNFLENKRREEKKPLELWK
ncbi:MAG: KH domain-containing protein [Candidatus Hadarchaeia archaeon]